MDKELLVNVLNEINDNNMKMERVIALLDGLNEEDITEIKINSEDEIEVDGATYKVLSDDEAEEEFIDYQNNLFDEMGLSGYSENFQTWIKDYALDEEFFDDIVGESCENYIEDIKCESEERLNEEMENVGVDDEDEFLDYLIDNAGNSIEYVIDNFGEDYLDILIENNPSIIDLDKIIEEIKSWDGRGCLAYYDGEELELDNDYFAYRID